MSQIISFKRPDGIDAPGLYLGGDSDAPGIVLIQEWWGVNDQIKSIGQRLVELGYRVLIPDLYRGRSTLEAAEASHLMEGLDFEDAATQDVQGAAQYLKRSSQKVVVMGYCMGGAVALLAALKAPGIDAAVAYYGAPLMMAEAASSLRIPVLGHFAIKDGVFPVDLVQEFEASMTQSNSEVTFHYYDAGHAFCNETGESYDPAAASLAWERSAEFLAKTLRQ